jgi:CSLREA domain-containing protein
MAPVFGDRVGPGALHNGVRSALGALLAYVLLAVTSINAATIGVDTTDDDVTVNGNCTLREAIIAANTNAAVDGCAAGEASPVTDLVNVPAGTYNLTLQVAASSEHASLEGDLDILEQVEIAGAGMDLTVIDGQAAERVFHVLVADLTRLSIFRDFEIRNGNADPGSGGGILNDGTLELDFLRVTGNSSNSAPGGGIMHNTAGALLRVWDCEISNNRAVGNSGGGISAIALVDMDRSTVSGNSATGGGGGLAGAASSSRWRIENSTISGNSSGLNGGGLAGRTGDVFNSTFVGNTSGSGFGTQIITTGSAGNMRLRNTIVAGGETGSSCFFGAGATITTMEGNFESPGDTCNLSGLTDSVGVPLASLGLTGLENFGGPTPTHGLFLWSVAIDAGGPDCLADDQRGEPRDDGLCDSGAFEVQPSEDVNLIFTNEQGGGFE